MQLIERLEADQRMHKLLLPTEHDKEGFRQVLRSFVHSRILLHRVMDGTIQVFSIIMESENKAEDIVPYNTAGSHKEAQDKLLQAAAAFHIPTETLEELVAYEERAQRKEKDLLDAYAEASNGSGILASIFDIGNEMTLCFCAYGMMGMDWATDAAVLRSLVEPEKDTRLLEAYLEQDLFQRLMPLLNLLESVVYLLFLSQQSIDPYFLQAKEGKIDLDSLEENWQKLPLALSEKGKNLFASVEELRGLQQHLEEHFAKEMQDTRFFRHFHQVTSKALKNVEPYVVAIKLAVVDLYKTLPVSADSVTMTLLR